MGLLLHGGRSNSARLIWRGREYTEEAEEHAVGNENARRYSAGERST